MEKHDFEIEQKEFENMLKNILPESETIIIKKNIDNFMYWFNFDNKLFLIHLADKRVVEIIEVMEIETILSKMIGKLIINEVNKTKIKKLGYSLNLKLNPQTQEDIHSLATSGENQYFLQGKLEAYEEIIKIIK